MLDGHTYKGNFVHGQMSGKGTYTGLDGRRYKGQWRADKYHGFGIYEHLKAVQNKGELSEGQLIRWL
ncbi:MAG: hypothetical protein ACKPKO_27510, partial [Candidatus Fonsibacter sp.]